VECKTILDLKKSSLCKKFCLQLQPKGLRPPRLYRLLKEKVPLTLIKDTIGALATCLIIWQFRNSLHPMRNSADIIQMLDSLQAGPQDIITSVDVVSLFTEMPVREALILLA
jgi:hypothetical protein